MNKIDKQFKKQYPHVYRLFQTAKAHGINDYARLREFAHDLYKCDVLDMTQEQANELMYRIHYASPRKVEHRKWHK